MALSDEDRARARGAAGKAAAELVEDGMLVGLGTGDTASYAVREIGARVKGGLKVSGVATSERTAMLARQLGIPLVSLEDVERLDLTVDGADEIDPKLRLIKGAGGALLREKLVARVSRRVVILGDADKRVTHLGERVKLPVELVPFGVRQTLEALRVHRVEPVLRMGETGPFVSDNGGWIADCAVPAGVAPHDLHTWLKLVTGVVETGLFLTEATDAFIGDPSGSVEHLTR